MGVEDYIGRVGSMTSTITIPESIRRDLFAAAALAGLLAKSEPNYFPRPNEVASDAVQYADALLAALDKPKGET